LSALVRQYAGRGSHVHHPGTLLALLIYGQLAVDMDSRLIVAPGLTQAVNDQQQVMPTLGKLRALPPELEMVQALVADNGFMSEANK